METMEYVTVRLERNWIRIGDTFNLLVELDGCIFYKKFRVYDTKPGSEPVIELNKKLKEYDLIELVKNKHKIILEFV